MAKNTVTPIKETKETQCFSYEVKMSVHVIATSEDVAKKEQGLGVEQNIRTNNQSSQNTSQASNTRETKTRVLGRLKTNNTKQHSCRALHTKYCCG